MTPRQTATALFLALSCALWAPAIVAGPGAQPTAPQAAPAAPAATGVTIVPDRFLRRWDPVTIFFGHDLGPAKGGPEDAAARLVTMTPAHPGAFRWLDARTLQFKP